MTYITLYLILYMTHLVYILSSKNKVSPRTCTKVYERKCIIKILIYSFLNGSTDVRCHF